MKQSYSALIGLMFALFLYSPAQSQITITTDHMPSVGDTVRISTNTYQMFEITDPEITGQGYTWDYSNLEAANQEVLQFISPLQTPAMYQLTFNPQVANLAVPLNSLDFANLPFSNIYEYYKNTASAYVRAGYAANVLNFPVPMKFTQPERLYKFPLSISSSPDTSVSEITVQYPTVAYFHLYRKRINQVDGYGTLKTPFGNFNTLRVKSTVYERDSLYLDSIGTGVPVIRNIVEYKWLTTQYPVPVLTITAEGLSYNVQFIDSIQNITPLLVSIGNDIAICQGQSLTLNAQASGGFPPYRYLWNTLDTLESITVTPEESQTYTVMVTDSRDNVAVGTIQVDVIPFEQLQLGTDTLLCAQNQITVTINQAYDVINWYLNNAPQPGGTSITIDSTGIGINSVTLKADVFKGECSDSDEMIITFQICGGLAQNDLKPLIIMPNPAKDHMVISATEGFLKPLVTVYNTKGEKVQLSFTMPDKNRLLFDTEHLKAGIYSIMIQDSGNYWSGKFIKN